MNISKILENTKPSSLPSWSSSSSSAFEKYNRINVAATTPVRSSDANEANRFLNFPPYSWSNLNDLSTASVKTSHDQTGDEYSVSHFPKLNARPLSCRVSKKHSVERRPRTTFNVDQTGKLEEEYGKNEYVSRSRRVKLAQALDLTEGQVKIWFQNRRAKDKRIEKAQLDQRVRYIALNMALSCPSLIGRNPTLLDVRSTDSNGVNETR